MFLDPRLCSHKVFTYDNRISTIQYLTAWYDLKDFGRYLKKINIQYIT